MYHRMQPSKTGRPSLTVVIFPLDMPRPGPPKTVTTPEIIDQIHELIFRENAPAHRALATQKNPSYLGFQRLDHPLYSPDLAPSDYHLFPGLKKK